MRFKTTENKGFQITFDNGITLSTQFGPGNYADNYDAPFLFGDKMPRFYSSDESEIAIWKKDGTWITKEYEDRGDNVLGYVPFEKWLSIFDWCRNYKVMP